MYANDTIILHFLDFGIGSWYCLWEIWRMSLFQILIVLAMFMQFHHTLYYPLKRSSRSFYCICKYFQLLFLNICLKKTIKKLQKNYTDVVFYNFMLVTELKKRECLYKSHIEFSKTSEKISNSSLRASLFLKLLIVWFWSRLVKLNSNSILKTKI